MAVASLFACSKSVRLCVIRLDKSSSDVSIFFIRLVQSGFRISSVGRKGGARDTQDCLVTARIVNAGKERIDGKRIVLDRHEHCRHADRERKPAGRVRVTDALPVASMPVFATSPTCTISPAREVDPKALPLRKISLRPAQRVRNSLIIADVRWSAHRFNAGEVFSRLKTFQVATAVTVLDLFERN